MQDVGVDILVIFLLLVGVILLTGASLGGTLRATGSGVAETTRMMRALGERRDPEDEDDAAVALGFDADEFAGSSTVRPPEPAVDELIVRATHVEGPAQEEHPTLEQEQLEAEPLAEVEDEPAGSEHAERRSGG